MGGLGESMFGPDVKLDSFEYPKLFSSLSAFSGTRRETLTASTISTRRTSNDNRLQVDIFVVGLI